MGMIISDFLKTENADGTASTAATVGVKVSPSILPFWNAITGTFYLEQKPQTRTIPGDPVTGAWSVHLPWPSESDPSTVLWRIQTPDGAILQGAIPQSVAGPKTLKQLKDVYGWGLISPSVAGPVSAIQGPQGTAATGRNMYRVHFAGVAQAVLDYTGLGLAGVPSHFQLGAPLSASAPAEDVSIQLFGATLTQVMLQANVDDWTGDIDVEVIP